MNEELDQSEMLKQIVKDRGIEGDPEAFCEQLLSVKREHQYRMIEQIQNEPRE
jgi:hypothetical protein